MPYKGIQRIYTSIKVMMDYTDFEEEIISLQWSNLIYSNLEDDYFIKLINSYLVI